MDPTKSSKPIMLMMGKFAKAACLSTLNKKLYFLFFFFFTLCHLDVSVVEMTYNLDNRK